MRVMVVDAALACGMAAAADSMKCRRFTSNLCANILECDTQTRLKRSRRRLRRRLAERVTGQVAAGIVEIYAIERVEGIQPDLRRDPLADAESLGQRHVHLRVAGPMECVAAKRTGRS